MRGVLDCNAEDVSGELTSTPPSPRCCKMILPCNTYAGKKTKPQLKYSLYWLLLRLVVHSQNGVLDKQWELANSGQSPSGNLPPSQSRSRLKHCPSSYGSSYSSNIGREFTHAVEVTYQKTRFRSLVNTVGSETV